MLKYFLQVWEGCRPHILISSMNQMLLGCSFQPTAAEQTNSSPAKGKKIKTHKYCISQRSRVCLYMSFSNLSLTSVSVCFWSQGGNDYEIYSDPRTVGHEVSCPEETQQLCQQLFFS